MKRILLVLFCVVSAVRLASASNTFSYTATGSPGANPDGVDQGNNPVSVWTIIQTPGGTNGANDNGEDGQGVYFGNPDGAGGIGGSSESSWQSYSYQNDGADLGGSIDATNQFAGGPLTAGQTVSLNFVMRATDASTAGRAPGLVGVSLLSGTNVAVTFYIYGGGPGYYLYADAGGTNKDAGPMSYEYQSAFNIAFTITGANTYTAEAGSDNWGGTFSGPITGIDVFNHAGGNGSDVGFNNLAIAPELAINNITPNDNTALFNATNKLTFTAFSPASPVNKSGVQLVLNGVNVSSNLVLTGAGSDNISAAYTNLVLNQNYTGLITVSNEAGVIITAPVRFDTFSSSYFTWEAEDFDFNGGQFIDNPVLSTNSVDSYYNMTGETNVDENVLNYSATQPHLWRTNDEVSTALAGDTPRTQFTAAGIPDYLIGYFNPGNWVNYTKTFPAGIYNVYGRLANGNGGTANCSLALVTSGQGTTNQVTTQLGMFQFTSRGWNSFDFIPLTDQWGNLLAVKLNGQTTLRVTSGQLGGGVNVNFFMLAPGTNTPPAITSIYPDGQQPFETTNVLAFNVSSSFSTVSQNNIQVTLNGVNVSSQLSLSGSSTNWAARLPLPSQGLYTCIITAKDANGNSQSYTETFDTFSQNNLMIEAGDFDFNGGQWIDNPLETASAADGYTNSYFLYPGANSDNSAEYGIDYDTTNVTPSETYLYRFDGNTPGTVSGTASACGTEITSDFLRDKFINEGPGAQPPFEYVSDESVPTTNTDYDVAWWGPGLWLNYTRTFPTNTYLVYGRLANGTAYANATVSRVTLGRGTSSQTTQLLGSFSDPNANGFQSWHWIPLTGNNGQPLVLSLGGVETLQVTAPPGPAAGSLNAHFYMFVPAVSGPSSFPISASVSANTISVKFQTQSGSNYTVLYSTSLSPANWQTLTTVAGDGTVKTVTDTVSGSQRYYRVQAN
jgi:hypothetical protein